MPFAGFLRSLSLHVQVCWKVVPGPKFFWGSILVGVGVPILLIAIALPATGVSYRFGDTCHINHEKALGDYWGPLLSFAAISTILQFTTFGYCIKVYIKSLFDDTATSDNSSGLPSYNSSVRTVTAKQAFRRIKKVVALQWRSILIVLIIIANVVFLSIVFISMDNTVSAITTNVERAQPWLLCLAVHNGDKTECWKEVGLLVRNESTVMAALILLSVTGFLFFLSRVHHVSTHPLTMVSWVAQRVLELAFLGPHLDGFGLDSVFEKAVQPLTRFCVGRCSTTFVRPTTLRNDSVPSNNGLRGEVA